MAVAMLDLRAQYAQIKDEIDAAVLEVLASQVFRGGPVVENFEGAIADYVETEHALGVASGTDALLLAYKALGVQPGDEIITTTFTFFATAGAIVNAGAVPVFVDIDPKTYLLDVEAVAARITDKTRIIAPVHLYGQCVDMDRLSALVKDREIALVEDGAQAIGARYKDRMACSLGDAATLSFYPTKNLGAAGEGGMITTSDDDVAARVKMLRCHGSDTQYLHEVVGTNSHLHAIQAAVLGVKLKYLDTWTEKRRAVAARYDKAFGEMEEIVAPEVAEGNHHIYHQYVVRVPRRDDAVALFRERSIGCGVFYPKPLHVQACFAQWGYKAEDCPHAMQASAEVLALPIHPDLTEAEVEEVIGALKDHLMQ